MPIISNELPKMREPDADDIIAWNEWIAERPNSVRSLCEQFPPWHYYDMPKTGQIAVVEAWCEDGTMRVSIVGDRISIPPIVPLEVFGVGPDDLVRRECPTSSPATG